MKKELNSVFKYCNINKLYINYSKTTYMVISSARLRSYIHIPNIAHVDLDTSKQLYYSFIYPYLSYAIITWRSACEKASGKRG